MAAAAAAAIAESAASDAAAEAVAGSAPPSHWPGADPVRGRSRSDAMAERGGRHRPWSTRGGMSSHWWSPNGSRGEDSTALPTLTADPDEQIDPFGKDPVGTAPYDGTDEGTPTPYSSAALYGDTAAYATITPKDQPATASRLRVPITIARIDTPSHSGDRSTGTLDPAADLGNELDSYPGNDPTIELGTADPFGAAGGVPADRPVEDGIEQDHHDLGESDDSCHAEDLSADRQPSDLASTVEADFGTDESCAPAADTIAGAAATVGAPLAIAPEDPQAGANVTPVDQPSGREHGSTDDAGVLATGVLTTGSLVHRGPNRRTVGLAPRPPARAKAPQRKLPRKPAVALTAMVLFGLLSGFFAWISAEPFWLAVGHSQAGVAVVTECTGAGTTRRCYASFTDRNGLVISTRATLVGAKRKQLEPASTLTARMVGENGRIAYAGTDRGLRARGLVGLLALLVCGALLAWLSGAGRLPTRANRTVAYLISMVGPLLLFAGMCVVTW